MTDVSLGRGSRALKADGRAVDVEAAQRFSQQLAPLIFVLATLQVALPTFTSCQV